MSGFWQLEVRGEFSAAHALREYRGKCENPHGHNFRVLVAVRGDRLDAATGMLLDFAILKKYLAEVLAGLDHRMLNDAPPFDRQNPSSENLARHIWERMAALLEKCPDPQARFARLHKVTVSEKEAQSASWFGAGA